MIQRNNTTSIGLSNFRLDTEKSIVLGPPSPEFGDCISAFFLFETRVGRGRGLVRLTPADTSGHQWKAFTFYTSLQELKGHEERTGRTRPRGVDHGEQTVRQVWLEKRSQLQNMEGVEPAVLVIGGGHGGLNIAARLGMLDIPTLIIEKNERVGDNWRKRYKTYLLSMEIANIGLSCMTQCGTTIFPIYHFRRNGQYSHRKVNNLKTLLI